MTPRNEPPARRLLASRNVATRGGFTLIELLVVITIIAILTTLIAVAGVGFIGSAREAATRTTIKKVEEAILERVGSVNRWHQRPVNRLQHDWRFRGWETRWLLKGQTNADTTSPIDAMMVLSRKGMLLELLPTNTDELKNAYWFWARFQDDDLTTPNYIMMSGYRIPYLNTAEQATMTAWLADIDGDSTNNVPKPQALDTPAEVFYYALLNAPIYGGQRVAEEDFKPSELVDTDADGVPELGDAWGNALRFYRWPTRLVNDRNAAGTWAIKDAAMNNQNVGLSVLMPNAPTADLGYDPDDRAGYLPATTVESNFHDSNTWHAPLLVSAGPDGLLGLREPNDIDLAASPPVRGDLAELPGRTNATTRAAALEELYDNITNHAGRAGGAVR